MPDLGYMVPLRSDIGAPKNIGEDYRRNTPVLYYAFDENFLDYFGSNGVWAVDQAFAILNNSLTNVSSYSADLSEIPLEAKRFNQTAGALNLHGPEIGGARHHGGTNGPGRPDPLHLGPARPARRRELPGGQPVPGRQAQLWPLCPRTWINSSIRATSTACSFPTISMIIARIRPPGDALSEAIDIPVDVPINALRFTPVSSFTLNTLVPGQFYTRADPRRCGRAEVFASGGPRPLGG